MNSPNKHAVESTFCLYDVGVCIYVQHHIRSKFDCVSYANYLVRKIDAQLLQAVTFEIFKPKDIEQSWKGAK